MLRSMPLPVDLLSIIRLLSFRSPKNSWCSVHEGEHHSSISVSCRIWISMAQLGGCYKGVESENLRHKLLADSTMAVALVKSFSLCWFMSVASSRALYGCAL